MDSLQRSVGLPRSEVGIDGLPRRQVVGEQAPGASGAQRVDDGVDDFAQVGLARSASPFGRRKHGFKYVHWASVRSESYGLRLAEAAVWSFMLFRIPSRSAFIKHTLKSSNGAIIAPFGIVRYGL